MSGKRLLITGGFGNLGLWFSEYFTKQGYNVYILSKNIKDGFIYKTIQADITDLDELKDKLKYLEFDYLIHTASYNEHFHKDYFRKALIVNSLGTRNLIEVFKDKSLKNFIYLSTFHIYGATDGIIDETTPPQPKNDYALTHLFAEYYLNLSNFPYIIFRLTNSYGSPKSFSTTKWYLVLNDLVKSAYLYRKIVLQTNGEAKRDFIWMGDVCRVVERSFYFKESGIFNLSSKKSYNILYLAKRVQKIYKKRYGEDIDIVINREDRTRPLDLIVENSKLKKLIDFEFSEKFESEIENIFTLLESNYGQSININEWI